MSGRARGLADWILSQLNDNEIDEVVRILNRGTVKAQVEAAFTSDVNEFLTRAEVAVLTASDSFWGDE